MPENKEVNLGNLIDKKITVHLKGNQSLEGTLVDYDNYMNLVLKKATEYREKEPKKEHETVVIKGGNVLGLTT